MAKIFSQIAILILPYIWLNIYAQPYFPLQNGIQTLGWVGSMDYDPNSNLLYASGLFDGIDTTNTPSIAAYDGTSWRSLKNGINGSVLTIKAINGKLYAGGNFSKIDSVTVNNIAMWDGNKWNALGQGLDVTSKVGAIANLAYQIWVIGYIPSGNGQTAYNLANWDGSAWHYPKPPVNYYQIMGIKNLGGRICLYGVEADSVGNALPVISLYNGSTWDTIPADRSESYLYFDVTMLNSNITVTTGNHIKWYSGGQWQTIINSKIIQFADRSVPVLAISDPYAGPYQYVYPIINQTLQAPLFRVPTYEPLDTNIYGVNALSSAIQCMNKSFAAGYFDHYNYMDCSSFVASDNNTISFPGHAISQVNYDPLNRGFGIASMVYDSVTNHIVAGGAFCFANNTPAINVAMWDGNNWHPMGNGLGGALQKLVFYKGKIYAAGTFSNWHDSIVPLAVWSGSEWQPVITDFWGGLSDIAVVNGTLYIAGEFNYLQGDSIGNIAAFDGNNWQAVAGNALFSDIYGNHIDELADYQGHLIAVNNSNFTIDAPNHYFPVIELVGNHWVALDSSWTYHQPAFCASTSENLYIADDVNAILKWNGATWDTVVNGPSAFGICKFDTVLLCENNSDSWLLMNNSLVHVDINGIWSETCDTNGIYFCGGTFSSPSYNQQYPLLNNVVGIKRGKPDPQVTSSSLSVCESQPIYFNDAPNDFSLSARWFFPGGEPETSTNLTPVVIYPNSGTYYVYITSYNIYGIDTFKLQQPVIVDSCTYLSVPNQQQEAGLTAYPNPVNDRLTLQSTNGSIGQVSIYDISGKQIFTTSTLLQSIDIDFSKLPSGMYIAEVLSDNRNIKIKIVK